MGGGRTLRLQGRLRPPPISCPPAGVAARPCVRAQPQIGDEGREHDQRQQRGHAEAAGHAQGVGPRQQHEPAVGHPVEDRLPAQVERRAEGERQRSAEAMRAIYEQSAGDTQALFQSANERFAESVQGMKQMAAEMQRELESTRNELRRGVFELPQETAESAAQMRRVIVDQIEALAELNRIVARHGRNLDAVEPVLRRTREEPTLAVVGGRSEHPRVVNVTSGAGQLDSLGGGTPAYSLSKLALNGLTKMLASRLSHDRVLVNAVCPGWVATDMGGAGGRPVKDGAAGIVWTATLPDDGPTGRLFRDGRELDF